jgi:hypothetical protein
MGGEGALQLAVLRQDRQQRVEERIVAESFADRSPGSGSRIQLRPVSVASGVSTRSGTTRSSSSYNLTSNRVPPLVSFSQTGPPVVGAHNVVVHGRRCGCSTSPVRAKPAAASWSSS